MISRIRIMLLVSCGPAVQRSMLILALITMTIATLLAEPAVCK